MADRNLQKKVKAKRNKKIRKRDLTVKVSIILLIVFAIAGVITFSLIVNKAANAENADEIINQGTTSEYILLNLGSTVTCEPCRQIKPVIDGLKTKYVGQIDIMSYDVSFSTEGSRLASEYNVSSIPTLIFLKNGVEVYRTVGYRNSAQIEADFQRLGWI